MLSEIEQESLDIDWFFTNNEHIVFMASGGGGLPDSIAKSMENSKLLSSFFRSLPVTSEVLINPSLDKIKGSVVNDQYLSDFVLMAKRGLFSFDKTVLNNFLDCNYHLVARPAIPLTIDSVPDEIKDILTKSKYIGDIDLVIDSTRVV